jgi:hypothetical protein
MTDFKTPTPADQEGRVDEPPHPHDPHVGRVRRRRLDLQASKIWRHKPEKRRVAVTIFEKFRRSLNLQHHTYLIRSISTA